MFLGCLTIFLTSGTSNTLEAKSTQTPYAGISGKIYSQLPEKKILKQEKKKNKTKNSQSYVGYVIGDYVNIRKEPNNKGEILGELFFNETVTVYETSEKYTKVKYKNGYGYISTDYITNIKPGYKTFEVPYASMKTWMSYKAITSKESKQYKLQQIAYTGNYGIRMVNNRYCVALGSYFGCEIGQYFDLILENGEVLPCVMGDVKADIHTDSNNIITCASDCLSEFIVDPSVLNKDAKRDGNISSCTEDWNSHVVEIIVYEKVVKF